MIAIYKIFNNILKTTYNNSGIVINKSSASITIDSSKEVMNSSCKSNSIVILQIYLIVLLVYG